MTPFRKRGPLAVVLVILGLALAGYGALLRPGRVPHSIHSDIVAMHLAGVPRDSGARESADLSYPSGTISPATPSGRLA